MFRSSVIDDSSLVFLANFIQQFDETPHIVPRLGGHL